MFRLFFTAKPFPLESSLNSQEQHRAATFKFPHLQQQYRFAHNFKRWALSQSVPDIAPADWTFNAGRYGKPFCRQPVSFNLSHSGDGVAVLTAPVSQPVALGVDIECYRPLENITALMTGIFHPQEIEKVSSQKNNASQVECFFQIWTAKEALLKAVGTGITNDLKALNCSGFGGQQATEVEWHGQIFQLQTFHLPWGAISAAWPRTFPYAPDLVDCTP